VNLILQKIIGITFNLSHHYPVSDKPEESWCNEDCRWVTKSLYLDAGF